MNKINWYKYLLLKWIERKKRYYNFQTKEIKKELKKYRKKSIDELDENIIKNDYKNFFENFDNNIFYLLFNIETDNKMITCKKKKGFFAVCESGDGGVKIRLPIEIYIKKCAGKTPKRKKELFLLEIVNELCDIEKCILFKEEKEVFLSDIDGIKEYADKGPVNEREESVLRAVNIAAFFSACSAIALIFIFNTNKYSLAIQTVATLSGASFAYLKIFIDKKIFLNRILKFKNNKIDMELKNWGSRHINLKKRKYNIEDIKNEINKGRDSRWYNNIEKVCRAIKRNSHFVFYILILPCIIFILHGKLMLSYIPDLLNPYEKNKSNPTSNVTEVIAPGKVEYSNDENSTQHMEIKNISYQIAAQAHVRETHSVSSKSIDILQKDTEVEILDIYDEEERNLWYQIKYKEGKTGWVNRKVLRPEIQNAVPITSVRTTSGIDVSDLYDGYIETNWNISEDMIDHYSRVYVKLEKVSDVFGLILYNGNYCARDFDSYGTVSQIEVWTQEGGYDYKVDTEYNVDGAEILFKEALHTDEIIIIVKEIEPGENTGSSTINTACIGDIVVLGE